MTCLLNVPHQIHMVTALTPTRGGNELTLAQTISITRKQGLTGKRCVHDTRHVTIVIFILNTSC